MQHLVLITDMAPTVLCSSAFSPDYDFEGHRLQDLGDYAAPADTMFLSSVATDAGGAFVLSWWDGDRARWIWRPRSSASGGTGFPMHSLG